MPCYNGDYHPVISTTKKICMKRLDIVGDLIT
jgi:hypothetical protein